MNRNLMMAAAMALAAPGLVAAPSVRVQRPGLGGWMDRNNRRRLPSNILSKAERSADSLRRKGWAEAPCDAPAGWFWKRDHGGKRLHRLYREPVGYGSAMYDDIHDRYIVESGHGYRKLIYLAPEEFKARQDGRYF